MKVSQKENILVTALYSKGKLGITNVYSQIFQTKTRVRPLLYT